MRGQVCIPLSMALGSVPLFGGSSADGVEFTKTKLLHQGTGTKTQQFLCKSEHVVKYPCSKQITLFPQKSEWW